MRKKLVGLGVVMAAAIAFYAYSQFMTHSKKEIPVIRTASELTKVQDMPENRLSDAPELADKKSLTEKPWGRDPFEFPPAVELRVAEQGKSLKAVKAVKAAEPPVKKVTAILITDSRKVASINHKVVTVGDLIDGERVLEIKPDRVILQKGPRKQVITLDESPIQWTRD
jgi:hypothetical protein